MPEPPDKIRRRQLAYERTLYIYTSAFEHGNLDALAIILQEASHDPVLERMILETHEAYQHEDITGILDITTSASSNASVSEQPPGETITGSFASIRSNAIKEDERSPIQLPLERTRERRKGWRMRTQNLLTALIAAVIVGGFLGFFAVRASHPSSIVGSHPTQVTTSGIVVATDQNEVRGYKADNGEPLWNYLPALPGGMITNIAAMAVKDHSVIFAGNGQVYAIQIANGDFLWHATIGDALWSTMSIRIDNGIALINPGNSDVYALRMSDGKALWHYATNSSEELLAAVNAVVYVTTRDTQGVRRLVALHIENGTPIWSFPTYAFTVIVADDSVYVKSVQQPDNQGGNKPLEMLMALSVKDGHQFWQQNIPDPGGNLVETEQGVIILDVSYHFCGYRTSDGRQLWCSTDNTSIPATAVGTNTYAIIKDTIYTFYSLQNDQPNTPVQITARDVYQGTLRWRWSSNTLSSNSSLAALDQTIYVTGNNTLYALRASDGKELWHTNASGEFSTVATGS